MSVFTKVTPQELSTWLKGYSVGALTELKGITAGIENTNYSVMTTRGRFVLTLFEKLTPAELPFYLNLMAHLARHGIPCPAPIADQHNSLLGALNGKPATLVTWLSGAPVVAPNAEHCMLVGATLAEMHLAGRSYHGDLENPRGPRWWHETALQVMPFLDARRQDLLKSELAYQAQFRFRELPRGPVHADLFRDNVLFRNEGRRLRMGGVIDFYFAGIDCLLFDVAITFNDWCIEPSGRIDPDRSRSLLDAYSATRDFTLEERAAWPVMLRAGALRFWLSRLFDFYLPRPGELTHAHDPEHFRRILELRRASPDTL